MKRAIIFYNGNFADVRRAKSIIKKTDYIICADGGAKHAIKMNIEPDVVIGDFDSLSKSLQTKLTKSSIEWIRFPKEKDATDSELAMQFAIEKGYKEIIVFGLFGSRLDHLLTNILALAALNEHGSRIIFVEGNQEIQCIQTSVKLNGAVGDLVSLLPLNGDARGVSTKDLAYPLDNETLRFGYSRGISNVFTAKSVEISVKQGSLLCIHTNHNGVDKS